MKTAGKIILGLLAVSQFLFVLYISIPAIPNKIKDEKIGITYSFGTITFDLKSREYIKNQELEDLAKSKGINPDEIMVIQDTSGNTIFTITRVPRGSDAELLLLESFSHFKNPFFHRYLEITERNNLPQYSSYIQSKGLLVQQYSVKLYKGIEKEAIISEIVFSDNSSIYHLDLKIADTFYSVLPFQPEGGNSETLENLMIFLRTVNNN